MKKKNGVVISEKQLAELAGDSSSYEDSRYYEIGAASEYLCKRFFKSRYTGRTVEKMKSLIAEIAKEYKIIRRLDPANNDMGHALRYAAQKVQKGEFPETSEVRFSFKDEKGKKIKLGHNIITNLPQLFFTEKSLDRFTLSDDERRVLEMTLTDRKNPKRNTKRGCEQEYKADYQELYKSTNGDWKSIKPAQLDACLKASGLSKHPAESTLRKWRSEVTETKGKLGRPKKTG